MRQETRNWFSQAKHDMKTAKLLHKNGVYDSAAFHAFQSAEKALKAASYSIGHIPKKTHNLLELGEGLSIKASVMDELRKLTPHYVVSRYPDAANGVPSEIYTKEISKGCIRSAEEVLRWTKETLKS